MQASINRCLSQTRINWEGYATGRASGVIWGVGGLAALLVSVGVASTGSVGASASIIFSCSTKIQKIFMMACNNIFGFNPVGAPTCLRKQQVGKPSLNAVHPMLRQRAVFMMTLPGLINCGRVGPLGLVPGILTH